MLLFLVLVVLTLCLIYSWINFLLDAKKISAPGPFPWPLFGNGLRFLGDTSSFLAQLGQLKEEYGDAVRVYLLSSRYLVLSNPSLFEPVVTSTEYITKGESYDYLHAWLGQGLLTAKGNRWKSHRKLLTPAFHFNMLQTFLPAFIKNQKVLTKKLRKLADGTSFDLFPLVALAALDNVAESAMGVSINAQEDCESVYVRAIATMSELSMMRIFNPIMSIDAIFNLLPHKTRFDKALATLHGYTTKVIEDRSRLLQESNVTLANYSEFGIKKKSTFLDLLLLSEVDGERLDFNKIREEVDTFMFEGHDTTTSAICFILYCISNHKDVQKKLLAEQMAIFGEDKKRDPTSTDLQLMKYLELVIKESLRIFPTVPLIGRMTTKDSIIAGMRVPKDTTISLNIFHLHRDPKTYEDPLVFRPERFETVNASNKSPFAWAAFSAGQRNCIGQKFAMMELKVCISSIIQNFKILPSGVAPILCTDLVLKSKNGVTIKLLPRD